MFESLFIVALGLTVPACPDGQLFRNGREVVCLQEATEVAKPVPQTIPARQRFRAVSTRVPTNIKKQTLKPFNRIIVTRMSKRALMQSTKHKLDSTESEDRKVWIKSQQDKYDASRQG